MRKYLRRILSLSLLSRRTFISYIKNLLYSCIKLQKLTLSFYPLYFLVKLIFYKLNDSHLIYILNKI